MQRPRKPTTRRSRDSRTRGFIATSHFPNYLCLTSGMGLATVAAATAVAAAGRYDQEQGNAYRIFVHVRARADPGFLAGSWTLKVKGNETLADNVARTSTAAATRRSRLLPPSRVPERTSCLSVLGIPLGYRPAPPPPRHLVWKYGVDDHS